MGKKAFIFFFLIKLQTNIDVRRMLLLMIKLQTLYKDKHAE